MSGFLDKTKGSVLTPLPPSRYKECSQPKKIKMTIRDIRKLAEDDAQKRFIELIDLDDYLDECKTCYLLGLLHRGKTCLQENCAEPE